MPFTAQFNLGFIATLTKQIASAEYAVHPARPVFSYTLDNGTGDNQANCIYHITGTITGSSSVTLDLSGGGLVDAFGDAVNLTRIRAWALKNTLPVSAGTTTTLFVTGNIAGIAVGTLPPQAVAMGVAPAGAEWAVVAGSTDELILNAATATNTTYDLWLIGTR